MSGLRLLLLALSLVATDAHAHKPSDSYLTLRVEGARMTGHWDIALRDLDHAIGIDGDDDGAITWGELRARHAGIAAYALGRLEVRADGARCPLRVAEHLVDRHTDGAYAVLRLEAACQGAPRVVQLIYRLFFDLDPQHRGLVRLEHDGRIRTAVMGPEAVSRRFDLADPARVRQFLELVREGVWHIWLGLDHVLFLLALLLPAVLTRTGGRWEPVARFGPPCLDVARVVTAFTVAHSITLTAAALGLVALPSRWVESAIALSVLLAVLNNLVPLVRRRRWGVAFGFGLVHGFGFAAVLADLGLPADVLVPSLLGFNLGVEVGQLAIVALFLPLAFAARRSWLYRRVTLAVGSAAVAVVASVWLVERLLDLRLVRL